ncbi:DUF1775 domain-containing protein [Aeromicrobium sp. HA]|uniref:DUF1775 domain-containing protein n=1 Tax=unclassified Aeromicrobium TaxID=2633570 RepID=UPI0022AE93E9|nr:DUF1775 domain-containing protein [Aeromicrobium sp. HA]
MSDRPRLTLAAASAAVALVVGAASPAIADTSIEGIVPQGDGTTVLVVAVEDGCGDAPTTGLALEVPDDVSLIDATAPDGWTRVLDGPRVEFAGTGIPPGQATEFLVTARIGEEAAPEVAVVSEQQCGDGRVGARSQPAFEVTAESVDPRMTVREPPTVSPGADSAQIALVVGAFVLAVAAGTVVARRRSDRD